MKPEFEVGDTVHVRAYTHHPKKGLEGKVREFWIKKEFLDGSTDGRVFYRIKGDNVITQCAGVSIIESKLYEEPKE